MKVSIPTDIRGTLNTCVKQKPNNLVIDDLKWKYLTRSVLRGKNTLIVGPTGCGKTLAALSIASSYIPADKFFTFNLGSAQDARSTLIGNTHFEKSSGTIFNESTFVTAIKTPGALILLDEISRAHPDAWNILMSVLDDLQRYLRLDEKKDSEVVKVADKVTFIATANVGNEYTSTRVMDRALLNRFTVKIEMESMNKKDEFDLLKNRFNISDPSELYILDSILEIADHTRKVMKQEDARLTNFISTRDTVEMAELIVDGFSLLEIAENVIYPNFSFDGGVESERTYVKQTVQKYTKDATAKPEEPLFNKKKETPGGTNTPKNPNVPF